MYVYIGSISFFVLNTRATPKTYIYPRAPPVIHCPEKWVQINRHALTCTYIQPLTLTVTVTVTVTMTHHFGHRSFWRLALDPLKFQNLNQTTHCPETSINSILAAPWTFPSHRSYVLISHHKSETLTPNWFAQIVATHKHTCAYLYL